MGKIYTDVSLPDVLKYAGNRTSYPASEYGQDRRGTTRLEFARPGKLGFNCLHLAEIFVSDVNKGRFDGYTNGHVELRESSIAKIKSMDNQKGLVAKKSRFLEGPNGFLHIWDSTDGSTCRDAWAIFYFSNDWRCPSPTLIIERTAPEFADPLRVRGIVLPFVDERNLDAVVAEITKQDMRVLGNEIDS